MMKVIYAGESLSEYTKERHIFLAGPSPRSPDHPNWRLEALKELDDAGFDGVVLVPLPRDGQWPDDYDKQVGWEHVALQCADTIMFWVPRDMNALPALTTNVEFGMYLSSGKIVLGYPREAQHMRYLHWHANRVGIPVLHTLRATVRKAIKSSSEDWSREATSPPVMRDYLRTAMRGP